MHPSLPGRLPGAERQLARTRQSQAGLLLRSLFGGVWRIQTR